MSTTQESHPEAPADPLIESGVPEEVSLESRLMTIRDDYGFLPTSRDELSTAFALKDRIGTAGGAAGYLNSILNQQIKNQENNAEIVDPQAAVRKVANSYVGFAQKARSDRTALFALEEDLKDREGMHNFSSLRTAGIQVGAQPTTGVEQLVRFIDLRALANYGLDELHIGFDPLKLNGKDHQKQAVDHYTMNTKDPAVALRIEQALSSIRVVGAASLIKSAIEDQEHRFEFWAARLEESRKHLVARPIAFKALQSFGLVAR